MEAGSKRSIGVDEDSEDECEKKYENKREGQNKGGIVIKEKCIDIFAKNLPQY